MGRSADLSEVNILPPISTDRLGGRVRTVNVKVLRGGRRVPYDLACLLQDVEGLQLNLGHFLNSNCPYLALHDLLCIDNYIA